MSLQFISVKANVLNYVWRLIYLCISIDRMVEVGLRGKKNKMKLLVWPSLQKLPFDLETKLYQRHKYLHTLK